MHSLVFCLHTRLEGTASGGLQTVLLCVCTEVRQAFCMCVCVSANIYTVCVPARVLICGYVCIFWQDKVS